MKIKQLQYERFEMFMKKYKVSLLCSKILASMPYSDEEIDEILNDMTRLSDFDLSYFNAVRQRLLQAKANSEKVLVCGDYDCDGVCATTIMYDALNILGIECGYYIPNRFTQGYGLQSETVQMAYDKGYSILITVDNGVKAKEALKLAKALGICIILSDHHSYEDEDLIYDYFLHPKIFDAYYHDLCGAGVAYLLSRSLIGNNDKHTMLACVATIGDVVSLTHANRIIVKEGLKLLNTRNYMALQLLQNDTKRWNVKKVAFQIVPKLNCLGRMANEANVNMLVRYLLLKNDNQIQTMLYQINTLNEKRKEISSKMEETAKKQIYEEASFLILYDESFHEGINGIVASKINSLTRKPVMVLSLNENILKGSIRSNSIDLTTFFDELKPLLHTYGGHKEAAGISFEVKYLDEVKKYCEKKMKQITIENEVEVLSVNANELTLEAMESLSVLEPMGCGFEMPLLAVNDDICKVQTLSNGKHLKYFGQHIQYLCFSKGEYYNQEKQRKNATFIGKVEINQFFSNKSVNMIVDYLYK